jgi:YHS domain-containing protein
MFLRTLAPLLLALLAAQAVRADMPAAAHDGWGLAGHDPVSYFADGVPRAGRADFVVKWRGQMWHFSTPENRAAFEADPARFAPRFRGYCVVALASGRLSPGDPTIFVIHDNQLFLLRSDAERAAFLADPEATIGAARQNWQNLIGK